MTAASRGKLTSRHAGFMLVLALLGVATCWRAWIDIFQTACERPEYQHIFLVPIVAAYLAYVRRERLKFMRVTTVGLGSAIVLGGWVLAAMADSQHLPVLNHLSAVAILVGTMVAVVGKQLLFRFFPVAAALLLMVPLPGTILQDFSIHLQQWTAQIASYLLSMIGVDTEVLGSTLVINGHAVFIDEACNGMRMVFPLLLIAYGFAFGLPLRASVRLLIVLVSPLVAVGCNVLRVLPLVWLQGQGPMGQRWGDRLHDQSGWVMVPLAFLVLLGLIRLLKWAMLPVYRYPLASQSA